MNNMSKFEFWATIFGITGGITVILNVIVYFAFYAGGYVTDIENLKENQIQIKNKQVIMEETQKFFEKETIRHQGVIYKKIDINGIEIKNNRDDIKE